MAPFDRRTALGMFAAGAAAPVLSVPARAAPMPNSPAGPIDVTQFGAVADGVTDNASFFEAAIDRGVAIGRPIFVPAARASYKVGRTISPLTGIFGEGHNSVIEALDAPSFSGGRPIVRIGEKFGAQQLLCTVPVQGFRVRGQARRARTRSSDFRSIGFAGVGILFDESAHAIHAYDVEAEFCYKGIVNNNNNGHLGGTNIQCSNNWFNLYWQRNTGDYRYFDCDFSGALFASYGCSGRGGIDTGGITGLVTIGCHAGFSPYGIYQEDGDGTVGIDAWTSIQSSFEQIGNQVIRLGRTSPGQQRVSRGWNLDRSGHSWTQKGTNEYFAYTILDDPRTPIQEIAVDLDLVQGSPITITGGGFVIGTSGDHTRIANLLAWVHDNAGIGGYRITGQGSERLVYTGAPSLRVPNAASAAVLPARRATLTSFAVPPAYDNTPFGEIEWHLFAQNHGARAGMLQVGVAINDPTIWQWSDVPLVAAPGAGNLHGTWRFPLGRRDRRADRHIIHVTVLNQSDAAIDARGTVTLTIAQDCGIVG